MWLLWWCWKVMFFLALGDLFIYLFVTALLPKEMQLESTWLAKMSVDGLLFFISSVKYMLQAV